MEKNRGPRKQFTDQSRKVGTVTHQKMRVNEMLPKVFTHQSLGLRAKEVKLPILKF